MTISKSHLSVRFLQLMHDMNMIRMKLQKSSVLYLHICKRIHNAEHGFSVTSEEILINIH